ncbi:MAG: DUF4242 domain-containing protein [Microthrixaceae bacterium]|nr:DUF4242 domain-containing protein [Microthrixaceae bacterium]
MSLFLTEITIANPERDAVETLLAQVSVAASEVAGSLLDAQVSEDLSRIFAVFEHGDAVLLAKSLDTLNIVSTEPAEVRLVGATIEEVREHASGGEYLVEWDLPAGLTMDAYLERKKEKSPLYAQVPEVTFLRTYVREDLGKCLCFYDAPDEEAVCRARDVVGAPVDRLHKLADQTTSTTP